jgi:hypothetical protein
MLTRRAALGASTLDLERRTAMAVLASETPVLPSPQPQRGPGPWDRPDGRPGAWNEVLTAAGADLTRAAGASVLIDHVNRARERIGVIETATVVGAEVHARLKFSSRAEVAPLLDDIRELGSQLSVGYTVAAWEGPDDQRASVPTFRATSWQLLETSLVAVAADPSAKVRSHTTEDPIMPETTVAPEVPAQLPTVDANALDRAAATEAERTRIASIMQTARTLRIDQAVAERFIADGTALQDANAAMLRARAAADEADRVMTRSHISGGHDGEDPAFRTERAVAVLAHRLSDGRIALPESAREVRGMRLQELHRYVGDRQRGETRGWLSRGSFGGGHTTSDFPTLLLGSAGERVLAESFMINASPLRQVSRTIQVDDFRTITRARRGEAAKLEEINEHGEVQSSTVGEEKEEYVVKTYARNFTLTRNAIVNDDLNAFGDFLQDMGRAAAITEAGVLVGLIVGAGATLADGTTLWHANHGNLITPGHVIGEAGLSEARRLLRMQASMTNSEPLNLSGRFLLVCAEMETSAQKQLATIQAAQVSNANVFAGALTVLVEPRLDAHSTFDWYVIADPASLPFLEIATLNGSRPMASNGAPQLDTFQGEDVLGLKWRAVHDFGAWPVNYRAAVKNEGGGGSP